MATEAAMSTVQVTRALDAKPDPTESSSDPDPLVCPQCGGVKSLVARRCSVCARRDSSSRFAVAMASVPWAPRETNAFRVYCVMCGRSSEVSAPAARLSRCAVCGGTQLTEDLT